MSVKAERPVITPEPFSGEQSWEDWIDQFESIASINGEQKLIWLKVRLTGRALLAYKKFSIPWLGLTSLLRRYHLQPSSSSLSYG